MKESLLLVAVLLGSSCQVLAAVASSLSTSGTADLREGNQLGQDRSASLEATHHAEQLQAFFNIELPTTVRGGKYTCSIDQGSSPGQEDKDITKTEKVTTVERVELGHLKASVALLESSVALLTKLTTAQEDRIAGLESAFAQLTGTKLPSPQLLQSVTPVPVQPIKTGSTKAESALPRSTVVSDQNATQDDNTTSARVKEMSSAKVTSQEEVKLAASETSNSDLSAAVNSTILSKSYNSTSSEDAGNDALTTDRQEPITSIATTTAPTTPSKPSLVSFNVGLAEERIYNVAGTTVLWNNVVDNTGLAYDPVTGHMTAPLTGRYYLAVTSVSPNVFRADLDLMVNGVRLCRVHSGVMKEVGGCQGVRHMERGQRAWIQTYGRLSAFRATASSFTGFLLAGPADDSRASFTVLMQRNKTYPGLNERLTWDHVVDNQRRAMDLATGVFTAPATGHYFLALTTLSHQPNTAGCARIVAGGSSVCYVCSCGGNCLNLGSCQAAVKLGLGEKAWAQTDSYPGRAFMAELTSLTGFFINGDNETSVSFTATLSADGSYDTDGQRLVWDRVATSQGGGYDNATGLFTAPATGVYFFAVSTRAGTGVGRARANVNIATSTGHLVCRAASGVHYDSASCQGSVRLAEGQQAWVQTDHCPCYFYADRSVFTGFYVQPPSP